ncbi:MAG: translation initiation factor IF-3 [Candidatus Zixiibacteriota bacterium]
MVTKELRINHQIRISPVRLIGPDGEQIGILPVNEAQQRARDLGLDLVEVAPNSRPPVCRILDYGKYKYELSKKDKAAKKKQHTFQLKEMRYRPKIDQHDFDFKTRHVREFLESGCKVKAFVMFRGREMAYTERGEKILLRVAEELADISTVEVEPKLDGRSMSMVLAPSQEIVKKMRQSKQTSKPEQKQRQSELVAEDTE